MKKSINQIITVFALAIFMLGGVSVRAQDRIEIPLSIKSKINTLKNENVTTITKFSKEFNGFISISFDNENKIVKIDGPKAFIEKVSKISKVGPSPMRTCYKDCMSNGGDSESQAWLCYWICLVELVTQ